MSDLQEELRRTLLEYRHLRKVGKHVSELDQRFHEENAELEEISKKLRKEEKDVRKFEGISVKAIFHNILGDREKQLEKERQEYLAIALKYNELLKSIDLLQYERDLLERKLERFNEVEDRYRELLERRERELIGSTDGSGDMLLRISREIDEQHVLARDIVEAIDEGRRAYKLLKHLEKHLGNARDWGQWDMYSDSPGWMKHGALDKARKLIHKVRHQLLQFRSELYDVYVDENIDVDVRIDRIDRFFDIFFDNLISDWVIQQKIKNAHDRVVTIRRQVGAAIERLRADAPVVQERIEQLEAEREEVILRS